jgi:hypothetical protein
MNGFYPFFSEKTRDDSRDGADVPIRPEICQPWALVKISLEDLS